MSRVHLEAKAKERFAIETKKYNRTYDGCTVMTNEVIFIDADNSFWRYVRKTQDLYQLTEEQYNAKKQQWLSEYIVNQPVKKDGMQFTLHKSKNAELFFGVCKNNIHMLSTASLIQEQMDAQ